MIVDIIFLAIIYILIGICFHWFTEDLYFNFKIYKRVDYLALFVDVFLWPIILFIMYVILPIILYFPIKRKK